MDTTSLTDQAVLLGNRLQKERETSEMSITMTAALLNTTPDVIESMERGEIPPSLPELELLAYTYRIPLSHLLGTAGDAHVPARIKEDKKAIFLNLRTRIIGATLKQARLSNEINPDDFSSELGISPTMLDEFESGSSPVPLPLLQSMCSALHIKMDDLVSPITPKSRPEVLEEKGLEFDSEISEFIKNPSNLPYLQLAKKLSEMDAAKLREIAENLLEITY